LHKYRYLNVLLACVLFVKHINTQLYTWIINMAPPPAMRRSRKDYLVNLLILLGVIVSCFFILDGFITFFYPIVNLYQYDPSSDYILKANQTVKFNTKEFKTIIHTNAYGLRGEEPDFQKERILVLGDSFTFGQGVNDTQTWPYLLQEQFIAKQYNFTVLNVGINGYDTRREYVYLKVHEKDFNPKMIIVTFVINDPLSNSGEFWSSPIATGILRYIPSRTITTLIEYLKDPESFLFKLGILDYTHSERSIHVRCLRPQQCVEGWNATFFYMDKLNDYAKQINSTFIVVNMPLRMQLVQDQKFGEYDPQYASYMLANFTQDRKIVFIDLANSSLNFSDYYDADGHWKPSGHVKAADAIYTILLEENYTASIFQ